MFVSVTPYLKRGSIQVRILYVLIVEGSIPGSLISGSFSTPLETISHPSHQN